MTPPGEIASEVAAEWVRRRPQPPPRPPVAPGGAPGAPGAPGAAPGAPVAPGAPGAPGPSALVLGDPHPHLPRALADAGHAVTRWRRELSRDQLCAPWPPAGLFGEAWVRMPRSALEAAMLLHAAAARVPDGARIHLYGAGNEGIRSAARHFPDGTGHPAPALIKRRCRVLRAARRAPPPRVDGLASWEVRAPVDWGEGPRDWLFYPGVFACGRLDPATALLIGCVGVLRAGARVLDFGAGTGIIAAAIRERDGADTEVVLLERDAIALAAASSNLPGATLVLGRSVAGLPGPFDLIVSNPPVHSGRTQSLHAVEALAHGAPEILAPRGRLMLVAQRRFPIARILGGPFRDVRTAADSGPFRVWTAGSPR